MSPVVVAGVGAPLAVLVLAGARRRCCSAPRWAVRGARRRARRDHRRSSVADRPAHALGRRAARRAGPRGAGRLGPRVLRALSPRAHAHAAPARPRHDDRALPQRRRGAARRHGDHRRGEPHPVGECAGAGAPRPRPREGHRPAAAQPACASPRSSATSRPAISPMPWSSTRCARRERRCRSRSCRSASTSGLLISRNITQLEAVARMRRDFIANVSHELKTPLTVVSGFLETLQDLELEPRQRTRYLQLMAEQARSMQRLVDDLLTLSALESEQNAARRPTFAIVPLLLDVSADAKALSAGRHTVALDIGDAGDRRRAAATSSRARSATSSATRSATRRTAARSRSAGTSTTRGGARSASPTPASASRPSTSRG